MLWLVVLTVGGLLMFVPTNINQPRGFRNNNPGNLEYIASIEWRGQIGTDGRFAIFDNMVNGVRANYINMRTKVTRDGADTVRKLITLWAPPIKNGVVENNTESYIQSVAKQSSLHPDQQFVFDHATAVALLDAVFYHENGQRVPLSTIKEGIASA